MGRVRIPEKRPRCTSNTSLDNTLSYLFNFDKHMAIGRKITSQRIFLSLCLTLLRIFKKLTKYIFLLSDLVIQLRLISTTII